MGGNPHETVRRADLTRELARWTSGLTADALPADVLHAAKRCLVDWLAVTLSRSGDPAARPLNAVLDRIAGPGAAVIVGRRHTVAAPFAALANGYFAHIHDYDDTYLPGRTTVHSSAPVWPAVLASAAEAGASGRGALAAFVAGVEVENRVALAAGSSHYERGWHVTGTVGHFGAAAASARILGLDFPRTTAALGTAGTQAAGLKEVYGSMGKPLHPGKAAFDGVLFVLLAAEGFTSTDTILEGPRGFLAVQSDDADPSLLTDRLGAQWTLLDNGFKPYACGVLMHPTIQAVVELREEHDLKPDDVVAVEAKVHDYVSWVTGKQAPSTGLQGKFSIYHAAAVALVDGAARLRQFTDDRVNAPDVLDVRGRVRITVDHTLPKEAAVVTITLADGRTVHKRVPKGKGTVDNPVSDEELTDKLVDLAGPVLGEPRATELADTAWRMDEIADANALLPLTQITS